MKTFIFHSVPILLRCNPEKGSYNPLCHWQQPQCRPPCCCGCFCWDGGGSGGAGGQVGGAGGGDGCRCPSTYRFWGCWQSFQAARSRRYVSLTHPHGGSLFIYLVLCPAQPSPRPAPPFTGQLSLRSLRQPNWLSFSGVLHRYIFKWCVSGERWALASIAV